MASKSKKKKNKSKKKSAQRSKVDQAVAATSAVQEEAVQAVSSKKPFKANQQSEETVSELPEVNSAYKERTLPQYAGVTLRGLLMGGADVIPGVSGGTMALIVGIYHELVASIRSVGVDAARLLLKGQFRLLSRHVNLPFLIALLLGIGVAIVSLARVMPKLLRTYPAPVNGLFFGLILASIVIVWRKVEEYNAKTTLLLIVGAIGAYLLVGLIPTETPNHLGFIFLCGMIAISAMILPGISGSFLLLLLGKYAFILNALYQVTRNRKIDEHFFVVIVFILGCACGIMAFSRVLNWMFERYHAMTLAALTGLMLGSLRKIWPFQTAGEEMHGAKQMIAEYLWPFEKEIMFNIQKKSLFLQNTWPSQWNAQYILAVILVLVGIVFVFSIDHFAQKREHKA